MQRIGIRREAWSPPTHRQGHAPAPNTTAWLQDKWVMQRSTMHVKNGKRCLYQWSARYSCVLLRDLVTDSLLPGWASVSFCVRIRAQTMLPNSYVAYSSASPMAFYTEIINSMDFGWHQLFRRIVGYSDTSSFLSCRGCGLSQFCRITRADSSSKYPEALQSSSQQLPAGRADGGNSTAAFHLSVTGQLNKYTSTRVFPHAHCHNGLLLVCIHSFSCSVLLWKTVVFWQKYLEAIFNIKSLFSLSRFSYNIALFLWLLLPLFHTPNSILEMNHSCC